MCVCVSVCCNVVQVSKISLVDLAGSERADSSGAKGMRLKVRLQLCCIGYLFIYLCLLVIICSKNPFG